MLIQHPMRKKTISKKDRTILLDRRQQQQDEIKKKGFTVVSLDESFFFYDSLFRRVWIDKNKRPIVRVTGSHKHSCTFGAVSIEGKQIFRQYMMYLMEIPSLSS